MNYDGSRGENFGKLRMKDNAKLTAKVKVTLNFEISCRIAEKDTVIDAIYMTYFRNNGRWVSKYSDETYIIENTHKL